MTSRWLWGAAMLGWVATGAATDARPPDSGAANYAPLALAQLCDDATPATARQQLPHPGPFATPGKACVDRRTLTDEMRIDTIDGVRNAKLSPPVYQLAIRVRAEDQPKLVIALGEAGHNEVAFIVNGAVVSTAAAGELPQDGTLLIGEYDSGDDARATIGRFAMARATP